MTAIKYNARDCEFEIEDFANPGTWVAVGPNAVNTFTKGREYETADTTTFGSEGQAEGQNMQIGKTITLEGFRLLDPDTGALDAGQALAEAQAERLGDDSLVGFRMAAPGDANWEVWAAAYFQLGDEGGGNNDKTSWSLTVTRSGPSTTAVKA
ncbi:phage tail tube protein [Streptomyces sp. NPDC059651]|uniref:phage tail tube protein n=1 Tax=Streptomyces sp. NPDC059651 TaxID=3346897 RepID=UPI0036A3F8A5